MKDVNSKPLVIDIDQTLLRTDMLLESFWIAVGKDAVGALKCTWRHIRERARLKHEMSLLSELDVSRLPVNEAVLELAQNAMREGREVILASGSDQALVDKLGERLGISGAHLGSNVTVNLTGSAKRDALVERYGENGFDYVGDAAVDLKVWQSASTAYAVSPTKSVRRALDEMQKPVTELSGGWRLRDLFRAFRPHQWVKNVLLLLPMIAAHGIVFESLIAVLASILAFSFAASSIYVVNDLLDLDADRQHETKRNRPFAAGTVPITVGMAGSFVLGLLAVFLALAVDWKMLGLVAVYMVISLSYSVILKSLRWIDIWALAILYTLRVVAGAVAANVLASGWLIAFVFPVFMALGCVKRLTELSRAKNNKRLPGRAYARRDRPDLLNIAILSAFNANIIFIAYTYSDIAYALYAGMWELRWCVIPLSAWMYRMISTGWYGSQDYDPIVFALRDRYSLIFGAVTVLGLLNAAAWV